jgi:tetratricopeptide (TPR) repeat protein
MQPFALLQTRYRQLPDKPAGQAAELILAQDGHWADWEAAGAIALDAAAKAADHEGLGRVHCSIARRAYVLGAQATANEHYLKMLEHCRLAGDVLGQAQAHIFITQSVRTRGRGIRATAEPDGNDVRTGLAHAEQAADLFRQVGQRHGEGLALTAMARFHIVLNSHELARSYALRALDLQRSVDNPQGQAHALHTLGDLHRSLGEFSDAVRYYHEALDLPVTFSLALVPRGHAHRSRRYAARSSRSRRGPPSMAASGRAARQLATPASRQGAGAAAVARRQPRRGRHLARSQAVVAVWLK